MQYLRKAVEVHRMSTGHHVSYQMIYNPILKETVTLLPRNTCLNFYQFMTILWNWPKFVWTNTKLFGDDKKIKFSFQILNLICWKSSRVYQTELQCLANEVESLFKKLIWFTKKVVTTRKDKVNFAIIIVSFFKWTVKFALVILANLCYCLFIIQIFYLNLWKFFFGWMNLRI